MKKLIALSIFMVVLAQPVAAMFGDVGGINIFKLLFGSNVENVFTQQNVEMETYTVLQYLFFPFISLWLILYGILIELRIFRKRDALNGLLAFFIAIVASVTGGLVIAVRWIFMAMGGYGFLAFAALFFVGVTMWVGARFLEWGVPGFSRGGFGRHFKQSQKVFGIEREIGRQQDYLRHLQSVPQTDRVLEKQKEILQKLEELEKARKHAAEEAVERAAP